LRAKARSFNVKSSQKIFADAEIATLTGICLEHLHGYRIYFCCATSYLFNYLNGLREKVRKEEVKIRTLKTDSLHHPPQKSKKDFSTP
jgi:hypothetical protein